MSDTADKESKTEEATEKKIRDTIEKGKLPFSKEAPILASFAAILIFMIFFAYDSTVRLGTFLSIFLENSDGWSLGTEVDAIALGRLVFYEVARVLVVVLVLIVVAGIAASVFQNSPRMVLDRIMPDASRISLAKGWSRLFGIQGFVEFLKSVGKLGFAVFCLVMAMKGVETRLLSGMITQPEAYAEVIRDIGIHMLIAIGFAMAIIAAADLFWSRFHWRTELRMTRQEVKDEFKQTDGDPIVKARIRSLARDRARQRMIASVPRATLVIANPTHFAIALRYIAEENDAPLVVAKGQDLLALRIREIAEENGVPVFENAPLARSMYKQVSVDSVIPPQFYQAVAELVRIVYGNSARASSRGRA